MPDTLESLEIELAAYWENRIIEISINGVNGTDCVAFSAKQWLAMSPIARVLAIHEKAQAVTNGEPFDVTGESYRKA
jgi:hypothetical protein